jgi:hypothetical protein
MDGRAERWSRASRAYAQAAQGWRAVTVRQPAGNPALRVGDADRQDVIAELQRHYVEGRLSTDELGERVNQALAARTAGELAQPLADLPRSAHQPSSMEQAVAWWAPFVTLPGRVLLAMLGLMLLAWLIWLPSMGGVPVWPVVFVGGFFFIGRRR